MLHKINRRAFQSETDQRSRLIYGGQLLKDEKTLSYYNIKPNQVKQKYSFCIFFALAKNFNQLETKNF